MILDQTDMPGHSQRAYDEELRELRSSISCMGGLLIDQLEKTLQVLRELDADGATEVIVADTKIDRYETHASQFAIKILARRAPVAGDLIEIVSASKIVMRIERMGDFIKNIAEFTGDIAEAGPAIKPTIFDELWQDITSMLQDIIDAFVYRNGELASDARDRIEAIEKKCASARRQVVERMNSHPNQATALSHYLMISENLRYIGTEAGHLAEHVCQCVDGDFSVTEKSMDVTQFMESNAH